MELGEALLERFLKKECNIKMKVLFAKLIRKIAKLLPSLGSSINFWEVAVLMNKKDLADSSSQLLNQIHE
jgi:hypothetical protein